MASFFYDIGLLGIFNGDIDLNGDTFKGALIDDSSNNVLTRIAATIANVGNINDINAVARQSVVSPAITDLASGNTSKWDSGTDLVFPAVDNGPIKGCLIYKFVTNDAGSTPICFLSGSIFPITTSVDTITVAFAAAGIGTATAS